MKSISGIFFTEVRSLKHVFSQISSLNATLILILIAINLKSSKMKGKYWFYEKWFAVDVFIKLLAQRHNKRPKRVTVILSKVSLHFYWPFSLQFRSY